MRQQVADRDAGIHAQFRHVVDQRIVIVQLALVGKNHNRHRRELLGYRGQAKGRILVDRNLIFYVSEAESRRIDDATVPDNHDSRTGLHAFIQVIE